MAASRLCTKVLALSLFVPVPACMPSPGTSPGATPVGAGDEIVLGDPPQEPKPTGLRPCPVDAAPGECGGRDAEGARVVTGERYPVAVAATDPTRGPSSAKVTLVVFSDYQCPFCAGFEDTLVELFERYPTELRVVWKDNPLPMHAHAREAALLARSAYARGGNELFWEVHDRIFLRQSEFDMGALEDIAKDSGLDWPPSEAAVPLVDQCLGEATTLGVFSTPTAFVNGLAIVGDQPVEEYVQAIDAELGQGAR